MSESDNKPAAEVDGPARPEALGPALSVTPPGGQMDELDPAGKALADALRISFSVLKIVMLAVLGLFIWSGVYEVAANEVALELRFGKVKGVGEGAIIETGLHWRWPAPIEEVIRVPAQLERTLEINSFWHNKEPDDKTRLGYLRIGLDGYNVTASSGGVEALPERINLEGQSIPVTSEQVITDYNLVHTNWRLRYIVDDPVKFAERLWDGTEGEAGSRSGWDAVNIIMRSIVSDAIVVSSANWDIERILWYDTPGYIDAVKRRVKEQIAKLDVGLEVKGLELLNRQVPRGRVKDAFDLVSEARLVRSQMETQARSEANVTISRAQAEAKIIKELARGYRKMIVEAARADAEYFQKVITGINQKAALEVPAGTVDYEQKRRAKFNELMEIYVDQFYQEMLRRVIDRAEVVYVADPANELRLYINRDGKLKPPTEAEKAKTQDSEWDIYTRLRLEGIRTP